MTALYLHPIATQLSSDIRLPQDSCDALVNEEGGASPEGDHGTFTNGRVAARAAQGRLDGRQSISNVRLTNQTIDGVFFKDVLVYRL